MRLLVIIGTRHTVKLRIEAGPRIDAGPRIQAGGLIHLVVPIEAGASIRSFTVT